VSALSGPVDPDRLAAALSLGFEAYGSQSLLGSSESVGLLKPLTYMNRSGVAVGEIRDRYQIPVANALLISDDYQLSLGRIRIRRKGGAGGHNGLASVIRTLGTEAFPRLRLGIGPVARGHDAVAHVLGEFGDDELALLDEVLGRAADAARFWLETGDIDLCMSRFNR